MAPGATVVARADARALRVVRTHTFCVPAGAAARKHERTCIGGTRCDNIVGMPGGTATVSSAPDDVDGRRARRGRNREAVVDALLDLFREGQLSPTAAAVAERSGVSLRSVFRYFDDVDEMGRIAIERHAETTRDLLPLPDLGIGDRATRIGALVKHRLRLYEHVAPVARATLLRVPFQPVLADVMAERRDQLRDQLRRQLAPELAALPARERSAIADAVDVMTSFESVELLRVHRGLSVSATTTVLTTALNRLLAPRST